MCCNAKYSYSCVQTLGKGGWASSSDFFSWKKPTFPILSPHFFCVTKKSCKITSANDILSKGEVQNVSPEIRAYY